MSIWWTIALVIMLGVAYAWGYDNGKNNDQGAQLDAERALELEKYKFDKFYEHERWLEERRSDHALPDA